MTEIPESEDAEKEEYKRKIPPEPDDTGSSGTQETSVVKAEIEKEVLLHGLPITRTVEGLAATKSRGMGGEVVAGLLAGSFTQLSQDLQQTKSELSTTQGKLDETKEVLSNFKVKSAVLSERVKSLTSGRHLKKLSITAGTALVGISIR